MTVARSPMRFAVVGTGRIAGDYLNALERVPSLELVAVADRRGELAASVAERWSVPAFEGLGSMLDAVDVDAVLVAVPPDQHEAVTVEALCHGAHVLCEKPFALDVGSARRMFAAAADARRVLTMSAKFRHVPDVIEAKARLDAGAIGTPLFVRQSFLGVVPMKDRWNAARAKSGGGVWIDNGTHSVDLLRYLFGPISRVRALASASIQELDVEDSIRVGLDFGSKLSATVDLSWSVPATEPSYLECFGTAGSLHLGWSESLLRLDGSRQRRIGSGYEKLGALGRQLEHFAAATLGREPLAMSAKDVLASVAVVESGYASLAGGGAPVDVGPVDGTEAEIA